MSHVDLVTAYKKYRPHKKWWREAHRCRKEMGKRYSYRQFTDIIRSLYYMDNNIQLTKHPSFHEACDAFITQLKNEEIKLSHGYVW
jgi:hypothetical protein